MLDQSAVGLSLSQDYSYDWRDIILYNLSVGAVQEEVEYVYEKGLKVLPSFGVIPCLATFGTKPASASPMLPTHGIPGFRPEGNLHMDHKLLVNKPLSPNGGVLHIKKTISDVYDLGGDKGAKIMIKIEASDESGEVVFTNIMGLYNRFAGGFGGEHPPKSSVVIPEGKPDYSLQSQFAANASLLYRLTGDTFPLHADPAFAKKCGFERPIVHGLCSFGYACRLLIDCLFPHEPERLLSFEAQFRSIAYPGDAFSMEIWHTGEKQADFHMLSQTSGKPILDCGRITWM